MPEIKHSFQSGKMNKDLDERLVPQGEYRDALNVQVRTSDGSDVGAVQSLSGNLERPSALFGKEIDPTVSWYGEESYFVGSISDEKVNNSYFFLACPDVRPLSDVKTLVTSMKIYKDMIIKYNSDDINKNISPVVTDIFKVQFTAAELGFTTNVTTSIDNITFNNTYAEYIRPGMRVTASNPDTNYLIQEDESYINSDTGSIGRDIKVKHVNYTTGKVTFDRYFTGNFSTTGVVWEFEASPLLNFHTSIGRSIRGKRRFISGINIINNLLLWTDNYNEPRKVNLDRCLGLANFNQHSDLYIDNPNQPGQFTSFGANITDGDASSSLKEEHITVIRRAPRTAPKITMSAFEGGVDNEFEFEATTVFAFTQDSEPDPFGATTSVPLGIGTVVAIDIIGGVYEPNQILILSCLITGSNSSSVNVKVISVEDTTHTVEIQSIDDDISGEHVTWDIKLEQNKAMFELKMGRFSYRYKYQDGEYSSFAPWSELAFLPSDFDYVPKKGYNLGMVNTLRNLKITDFIVQDFQRPDDIVSVDVLYKDTVSPNVYIVKNIERGRDPEWNDNATANNPSGILNITSEMIHVALPSNQSLRAWDNVPILARAQEVTGNRVVYANYLQNYNVNAKVTVNQSLLSEIHSLADDETQFLKPKKSLKSVRTYKLGVVFGDKYGRETPVLGIGGFTDNGSAKPDSVKVPKDKCANVNQLQASLSWVGNPDAWMEYYKYYVKETTNEYYNLVMDRWYNAEDGNVWLSFQSADRNKVDIETYLLLKNKHGSQDPVLEDARYKILAIENEAPDFIKTTNKILGQALITSEFNAINNLYETMVVTLNEPVYEANYKGIDFKGVGWARIRFISGTTLKYSDWVRVSRLNDEQQTITTIEPFGDSADVSAMFAGSTFTAEIEVKDAVVENRAEFDGRFFVKIYKDAILSSNVLEETNPGIKHAAVKLFEFNSVSAQESNHGNGSTYKGDYTNLLSDATPDLTSGTNYSAYAWSGGTFTSSNVNSQFANGCGSNKTKTASFWKDYAGDNQVGKRWFIDSAHDARSIQGNDTRNRKNGITTGSNTTKIDFSYIGTVYESTNIPTDAELFYQSLDAGTLIRFSADPFGRVYQITDRTSTGSFHNFHRQGTSCVKCDYDGSTGTENHCYRRHFSISIKDIDTNDTMNTSVWDVRSALKHDGKSHSVLEVVLPFYDLGKSEEFSIGNAIWETEPREDVGLDLYYEASQALPINLKQNNNEAYAPKGSTVKGEFTYTTSGASGGTATTTKDLFYPQLSTDISTEVVSIVNDIVNMRRVTTEGSTTMRSFADIGGASSGQHSARTNLVFTHGDGVKTRGKVIDHWEPNTDFTSITEPYKRSETLSVNLTHTNNSPTSQTMTVTDATFTTAVSNAILGHHDADEICDWQAYRGESPMGLFLKGNGQALDIVSYQGSSNIPADLDLSTNLPWTIQKVTGYYRLEDSVHKQKTDLSWFNCYSFGNGLESDRIRDDFNSPTIDNGCKVSTTLDDYGQELRSSGLIFSGIYNSTSGVNDLNEFNMAESITKDLNPSYGSIQALKSRDTNLVAFCEDKVLKILANKDALFNADGNVNVTASNAVLGDASGFSGDYGISTNPESLAVDGYRMYFTDKQRNKVLRLSQDGLTAVSDIGMKSWFRDNLKGSNKILGTFDEVKGEYNVTISYAATSKTPYTVSYNEGSKGWSSFKSFIPETGVSLNEEYLTAVSGGIWSHHNESVNANTFYGSKYDSKVKVLFNDIPGSVKGFSSINYEGTKSNISKYDPDSTVTDAVGNVISTNDNEYYNLSSTTGWYVSSFNTDMQEAKVNNFKDKEGKWFSYIDGITTSLANLDESEFTVQGIGVVTGISDIQPITFNLTVKENND